MTESLVWVWHEHDMLFFCESKPCKATESTWDKVAGRWYVDPLALIYRIEVPKDFDVVAKGESRQMKFHDDLWGKAKELPSYNKSTWTAIQQAFGF